MDADRKPKIWAPSCLSFVELVHDAVRVLQGLNAPVAPFVPFCFGSNILGLGLHSKPSSPLIIPSPHSLRGLVLDPNSIPCKGIWFAITIPMTITMTITITITITMTLHIHICTTSFFIDNKAGFFYGLPSGFFRHPGSESFKPEEVSAGC